MKANLTTVCSVEAQEEIRAFLGDYFEDLTISSSEKNQLILAVDEAVANAIIHGNEGEEENTITLDIDVTKKRISIEIHNIGLFDTDVLEKKKGKDLKSIIKDKQKGGLGLKLIYSIMDIVAFFTTDKGKSGLRMVKLFK